MEKAEVVKSLQQVHKARQEWGKSTAKFQAEVDRIMTRLVHEAAANHMSVEEVARAAGLTPKRVRTFMRAVGLDNRSGKTLLAQRANQYLVENANLLGIDPGDMDLTSPLAYLPAGDRLRQATVESEAVKGVKDLTPERDALATRLADTGLQWSEALTWIDRVIAEAKGAKA